MPGCAGGLFSSERVRTWGMGERSGTPCSLLALSMSSIRLGGARRPPDATDPGLQWQDLRAEGHEAAQHLGDAASPAKNSCNTNSECVAGASPALFKVGLRGAVEWPGPGPSRFPSSGGGGEGRGRFSGARLTAAPCARATIPRVAGLLTQLAERGVGPKGRAHCTCARCRPGRSRERRRRRPS